MRIAVLAAVALHMALIMGVGFSGGDTPQYAPQIEVTLSIQPSDLAPQDARHVSTQDQLGGGEQAEQAALTSPNVELPANAPRPQRSVPQRQEQQSQRDLLSTTAEALRSIRDEPGQRERQPSPEDGVSPLADPLTRELAGLQAELSEQTQNSTDTPRVRRLTSVAAASAVDAAYLLDWRRRLEAVGNKYYPQASIRYGLYGELRLLVVIRKDGSLEDIKVLSPSGYAVLDEAAIKIVRMAAPYAPFPSELRATTDKLEIVRTWQFQENSLSSD